MATTEGYGDNDLRAAFAAVREVRQRFADARGRTEITAADFHAALRSRNPELPVRPESADSPWPDSCWQWIDAAMHCYQAALAEEQAGQTEQATFHWAEGSYCITMAGHCLGTA